MTHQIRYIDLFAGCGGISLGFYNAGVKGLFAVERNPDAFKTLKHNLIDGAPHFEWPAWLPVKNWNINKLIKDEREALGKLRGQVDIVVGGPPCQGFSSAGKRRASDARNNLIHAYLEFVEIVQPRAIMFENVYGFTTKFSGSRNHSKVPYSQIVAEKLNELGYNDARGEMVDMSDYGVPQSRHRFVMIATRENLADSIFDQLASGREEFLAAKGIAAKNSTQAALSDLEFSNGTAACPDSNRFMSGLTSLPHSDFQKCLRLSDDEQYVPDSHRYVNHTPEVQAVFTCLLQKAPRNKRIDGTERGTYGVKKRNVTVLDPAKPSPTITTIPDDYVHYSEPRVMTVRECARLQTFPDWFEFKGPYTTGGQRRKKQTPRYTQVGNAVPPLFAEQVALAMKRVLSNG